MPLSITILTEGSLTASVVGQGIVASIVPSQALLEINVGTPGPSATVSVGTTTTGSAGTDASVVNVGTTTNAILDFTIPRGDKGEQGDAGDSATVDAGTTTTLEAGSDATVENVGTTSNAIFNFGIPAGVRGEQGERGYQGDKGDQGDAAVIYVGTTSTLSAGSPATVTNSGTEQNAVFNFGIPQGYQGVKGDKGDTGDTGRGVPAGGTFGQGLIKTSNTFDYETAWAGPFLSRVDTGLQGIAGSIQVQGSLDMDEGAIQNVDSIQVNTVNVTYGTSPKIHFGSGDQITPWIEAPSDGEIYGRKDGLWSTIPSGGGGSYLPLAGGNMSGDIYWPKVGTGTDSQIGSFGFGTENTTLGQSAYIEPTQIRIYNGDYVNGTSLTPNGINFNDETTQVTAYDPAVLGNYLPLTGGTVTGLVNVYNSNISDSEVIIDPSNPDIDGIKIINNLTNIYTNISTGGISTSNVILSNQLIFPDSTTQTTAWLGYNGTTSQYIRGDGSLYTFPPLGDRYLTSSTSTLTCDSGNGKTMTVGTGLSYSRQQDITVSYDTANHMHGTVLTYNSTTGVMTFDSNTHSGGGTYSNWEVNVGGVAGAVLPVSGTAGQVLAKVNSVNFNTEWISLGSMAQATTTDYLSKAGNLSGLASTTTARINLGLGTMAVETATDYLTKAGNLSGLASASTARTNLGLGAVSTDAYATTAQAQAGTSTTAVVNPSTLLDAKIFAGYKPLSLVYTWTSSVSGVGASTTVSGQVKNVFGPTAAIGSAMAYIINYNTGRGIASSIGADFTKRTTIGGRFIKTVTTADANSVFRFLLGKNFTSPPAGDLSQRGIGFRQVANGALELQVHNGTSLFNVTSSFTPTANSAYDVVIVADAGTATMFVNGSSVATSANAPTATLTSTIGILDIEAQNTSILSGSAMTYSASDMFVQTNL